MCQGGRVASALASRPRVDTAGQERRPLVKRIYLLSAFFVFVLAASEVCLATETVTVTIKSLS